MAELMEVPRPSHLDDWDLYRRLEPAPALRVPRQSGREGEALAHGRTTKQIPREQQKTNGEVTALPVRRSLEDGGPGNSVKSEPVSGMEKGGDNTGGCLSVLRGWRREKG